MFNGTPYGNYPYGSYMPTYQQRAYPPQQQVMPQIPQQPQQPQMQYEIPIQDVRFVTSEEAKAYIVMPNSKALLIDKQGGVAHLKTADNMGQSTTQFFRFEPINADGTPIKAQEPKPQVDFGEFIKRSDLESLGFVTKEQYNSLVAKIQDLQKNIVGGKANVGTKQA